jgi:hypothetical protein
MLNPLAGRIEHLAAPLGIDRGAHPLHAVPKDAPGLQGVVENTYPLRGSPAIADDIHLPVRRIARLRSAPGDGTPRAFSSLAVRLGDYPANAGC